MSFLQKRRVLDTVKARIQKNGYAIYEAYFGTDPFTGKPVRKSATSVKKLKLKIESFYKTLDQSGEAGAVLTRFQAMDAKQAIDMIAESGRSITLVECAKIALAGVPMSEEVPSITVGEAYVGYAKSVQDRSESYKKDIRLRVGAFVTAFGEARPVSDITAPEVKRYLLDGFYRQGDIGSWVTYNNHLGNIKSFVAWCANVEQKYLRENPLDGMKKIVIPYRQPEYMKAEDVRMLFGELWKRSGTTIGRADLAYAVLSFFCGMRQSEIGRAPLGEHAIRISIEERMIRVGIPKGVSKGIKPRAFTIPEQALAWMRAFDFMDGATTRNRHFRRHLVDAAEAAKAKLTKNAGRHTFITMFEAVHHDANALTAIVGNTDDVRARNYNGVELRAEGEAYFAILPTAGSDVEKKRGPVSEKKSVPSENKPYIKPKDLMTIDQQLQFVEGVERLGIDNVKGANELLDKIMSGS
jgi:integrase